MTITSPITEATGFYGYAILVSAGFCGLSWLLNLVYVFSANLVGETHLDKEAQFVKKKRSIYLSRLFHLPWFYWLIVFNSMLLKSCWSPFIEITR